MGKGEIKLIFDLSHLIILIIIVANSEECMDVIPNGQTIFRCVDVRVRSHPKDTEEISLRIQERKSQSSPHADPSD